MNSELRTPSINAQFQLLPINTNQNPDIDPKYYICNFELLTVHLLYTCGENALVPTGATGINPLTRSCQLSAELKMKGIEYPPLIEGLTITGLSRSTECIKVVRRSLLPGAKPLLDFPYPENEIVESENACFISVLYITEESYLVKKHVSAFYGTQDSMSETAKTYTCIP